MGWGTRLFLGIITLLPECFSFPSCNSNSIHGGCGRGHAFSTYREIKHNEYKVESGYSQGIDAAAETWSEYNITTKYKKQDI